MERGYDFVGCLKHVKDRVERVAVAVRILTPHKVEIEFNDGRKFQMSSEFLRVHSPAAMSNRRSVTGDIHVANSVSRKRHVKVLGVEPVTSCLHKGNNGIRIIFDDFHGAGVYTFNYLYHLGEEKIPLMRDYLRSLRRYHLNRE